MRIRDLDKYILVKLGYGGWILGSSQFLPQPHLRQKMTFALKVVKRDLKMIISLCQSKSVTHSENEISANVFSVVIMIRRT